LTVIELDSDLAIMEQTKLNLMPDKSVNFIFFNFYKLGPVFFLPSSGF